VATTELRAAGATLALCLMLLALPSAAQQAPGEQQLIERLRQIQDEIRGGRAAPSPTADDAAPADPALLPPQQVGKDLGERLGVEVLAVEPVEGEGGPRYAVKVMNPPGNYNGALMVGTLLVDATTGELLGEVTAADAGSGPATDDFESGIEARQRTWR
jgi:hypothetical protein